MEIRYINASDSAVQISNVYEQSWKSAYNGIVPQSYLDSITVGRWAQGIENNNRNNIILIENGSIVGTSCFCASRWDKFPDYGEIVSLYLLPEYTGRGYGRKLAETAINELNKSGYSKILLWVLEENFKACGFYEHIGFENSGETMSSNIGGKDLHEVMYIKLL